MTQQGRAHTGISEDFSSVPKMQVRHLTVPCHSSTREPNSYQKFLQFLRVTGRLPKFQKLSVTITRERMLQPALYAVSSRNTVSWAGTHSRVGFSVPQLCLRITQDLVNSLHTPVSDPNRLGSGWIRTFVYHWCPRVDEQTCLLLPPRSHMTVVKLYSTLLLPLSHLHQVWLSHLLTDYRSTSSLLWIPLT